MNAALQSELLLKSSHWSFLYDLCDFLFTDISQSTGDIAYNRYLKSFGLQLLFFLEDIPFIRFI